MTRFLFVLLSIWCNPQINHENRLPMHASFDCNNTVVSLDGQWHFNGYANPDLKDSTFHYADFDDSAWRTMPVPGMWELNGFGDPVYICNNFAWRGHYVNNPPIPFFKDNHVGQYRRTFSWSGDCGKEDAILKIGAATSNVKVWLNGEYVGYSEDSRLAAGFDITDKLREGENTIALEIFRWCDGTYLEDQDMWRMSGISRSIEIIRKPKIRMEDIHVTASASGKLDITMYFAEGAGDVSVKLISPKGRSWRWKGTVEGDSLHMVQNIRSPRLWSAETPNLYELEITVRDTLGNKTQTAVSHVGFRDVEVRGKQLLVNGKPVLIKGVNRHEMTARRGPFMTKEDMLEDMRQLKLLNINAVRTAHYPDDPYWYELCDKYGIYVMDEANIESHGVGYKPDITLADKKEWAIAHSERFQRMVQRDRNHPCIIMWSLGNEAGMGQNHENNYKWAKAEDPTRAVVYQILEPDRNDLPYTDIEFFHYRTPSFCEEYLTNGKQTRPFMLQEYAHAMGNSLGNFKEYWDLIRKNLGFQGGFIWDFADQALIVRDSIKIGGDFNNYDPWNASLSSNGLLSSDRKWHPHAWEAKYQMRDILITAGQDDLLRGKVTVKSEYFFKTIKRAVLKWKVLIDGEEIKSGSRRFRLAPQTSKSMRLGFSERSLRRQYPDLEAHDVRVHLSICLGKDCGLLKKGDEISWEDLAMFTATQPVIPSFGKSPETWNISFDQNGFPSSWKADGVEFLAESIRPCFGRAITENDKGAKLEEKMKVWMYPELKLEDINIQGDITKADSGWICTGEGTLSARYKVADVAEVAMTWTVTEDGRLCLREKFTRFPGTPPPFRIGVEFAMPQGFEELDFHGSGPFETYSDRKSSGRIARYVQQIAQQYHSEYVRPQESGNHTDLRYMAVKNKDGKYLVLSSDSVFSGSALPYSREDLDISIHEPGSIHHPQPLTWRKHFHSQDLTPDGLTHIHADLTQMGVGGTDTWGSLPLEEYMLTGTDYTFALTLSPKI